MQEIYPDARTAGKKLIVEGKKKTSVFVNNRLEGNAIETINAMLEEGE